MIASVTATGDIFPLVVKNSNAGDEETAFNPGRSSGEGHGDPLQYSGLENPMDRGAWWAVTVHGVTKSWTQLSDFHFLTALILIYSVFNSYNHLAR